MSPQRSTESPRLGWAEEHRLRTEVRGRYKSLWAIDVVSRAEDLVLVDADGPVSVLDMGAGNRGLKQRLEKECTGLSYKSLDTDDAHPHDYRDLSEIEGAFDRVVMFELIEHLPHEEGLAMLRRVHSLVREGGKLLVSTPNVYHPFQYFRDASHVTPYSYEALGAAVLSAGFELEAIYRIHPATVMEKLVKRSLVGWLFRLLGIDYAPGVVAVARKQG